MSGYKHCYPCGMSFRRDELAMMFDAASSRRWVLVCENCFDEWNRPGYNDDEPRFVDRKEDSE